MPRRERPSLRPEPAGRAGAPGRYRVSAVAAVLVRCSSGHYDDGRRRVDVARGEGRHSRPLVLGGSGGGRRVWRPARESGFLLGEALAPGVG